MGLSRLRGTCEENLKQDGPCITPVGPTANKGRRLLRASLSQWTSPGDERRRVQEVDKALSSRPEGSKQRADPNKPISLRLTPEERTDLEAAAARDGMTKTAYIKARIAGTGTRDRTTLAAIDGLHVAGMALRGLLDHHGNVGRLGERADILISEMRALVERLAKSL